MDRKAKRNPKKIEELIRIAQLEITKLKHKYKYYIPIDDIQELSNYKLAFIWDKIDMSKTPGAFIYTSINRHLIRHIKQIKPTVNWEDCNLTVTEPGYNEVELQDVLSNFYSRLSTADKNVVSLLVEGYSILQISKMLNINYETLYVYLAKNRALKWKSIFQEITNEKI